MLGRLSFFVSVHSPTKRFDNPPRFQRAVTRRKFGLKVAIGVVQFPVRRFHIANEISYANFEFSELDVRVDSSDQHSIVDAGSTAWSSNAIESRSAALQNRLPQLAFEVGCPGQVWIVVTGRVIEIVSHVVPQSHIRSYCGALGQLGCVIKQVLLQQTRASTKKLVVQRAIVFLEVR